MSYFGVKLVAKMLTYVSVCCAFRPIACLKLISIMRLCVPVLSYFGVKLIAKMLTEEFLWVVVGSMGSFG